MDLLLTLEDNSSYLNDINQDHLLGGMPFATPNYRKQVSENQQKYLDACRNGDIPNVKLHLREYQWYEDQMDNNCLFLAVKNNQPSLVETLLQETPKMNLGVNQEGENAYLLAAQLPNSDILRMLIQNSSTDYYLKATNANGDNLLQVAIQHSRGEIVSYLLSKGLQDKINIFNLNHKGENILHLLLKRGNQFGGVGMFTDMESISRRKTRGNKSPRKSNDKSPQQKKQTTKPVKKLSAKASRHYKNYTSQSDFVHIATEIAKDPQNKKLLFDVTQEGDSVFIMACKRGATSLVHYLCDYQKTLKLDLNLQDIYGRTGLHYLVGNTKLIKWVLDNKEEANIRTDLTDKKGYNVMGWAMLKNDLKIFTYMADYSKLYDIPVDQVNQEGQNLVLSCLANTQKPEDYLRVLYDTRDQTGIDFHTQGRKKETPLQLAIAYGKIPAQHFLIEKLDLQQLQLSQLADKGTVFNKQLIEPPVIMLAAQGRESLIKKLLEKYDLGIIQVVNRQGNTPLMVAIKKKQVETALYLINTVLKKGNSNTQNKFFNTQSIDTVNYTDVKNNTALHLAIYEQEISLINQLIDCTDLNLKNKSNQTPLSLSIDLLRKNASRGMDNNDVAQRNLTQSTVQMLSTMESRHDTLAKNPDLESDILFRAVKTDLPELVKAIIEFPGIDINCLDPTNNSVLMVSLRQCKHVIPVLLQDAKLKANQINRSGESAAYLSLVYAPQYFSTILDLASKVEFNINQLSHRNLSLLMLAAEKGNLDALQKILTYRPISGSESLDIYMRNKRGISALDIACKKLQIPSVILLVSHFRKLKRVTGPFGSKSLKIVVPKKAQDGLQTASHILEAKLKPNDDGISRADTEKIQTLLQILRQVAIKKLLRRQRDHLCDHMTTHYTCDKSLCEWGNGTCQTASNSYLSSLHPS